jgi:hypothetical protein
LQHLPDEEMSLLSNNKSQTAPETANPTIDALANWNSDWGAPRPQPTTVPAEVTNDIEEEGPWPSDPANPDEEAEDDAAPVNPRDRGCWTPRTATGEPTPRGGW